MNHRRICLISSAIVLVAGWYAGSSAARAEGRESAAEFVEDGALRA